MKFFIYKDKLNHILKVISCVVDKSTIDKLNDHYISFSISMNKLIVMSFNYSLEVCFFYNLESSSDDGSFVVSLKKFSNIVKVIPDFENIEIRTLGEELLIHVKDLKFRIGLFNETLNKIFLSDFNESLCFSISSIQLQAIYKKIFFSVAENDFRIYLNGIFFDIRGNILYTVTSDGHRLSMYKVNLFHSNVTKQFIIPSKNFSDIVNIFYKYEDIKIFVYDKYIKFVSEYIVVKTNLLIGKYPDYMSLFSISERSYLICSKKNFLNLFLRVSVLEKKNDCIVKMHLYNKVMHLSTYTNIKEHVEDKLECYYYDGSDIFIAFNSKYVIDILHSITSDYLLISIFDYKSAIIFEPIDFIGDIKNITVSKIKEIKLSSNNIYLLMPIRL